MENKNWIADNSLTVKNGPWYIATVRGEYGDVVARCESDSLDEAEANARIIANAPKMKEAIEAALRIVELWGAPKVMPKDAEGHEGEYEAIAQMELAFKGAINF